MIYKGYFIKLKKNKLCKNIKNQKKKMKKLLFLNLK